MRVVDLVVKDSTPDVIVLFEGPAPANLRRKSLAHTGPGIYQVDSPEALRQLVSKFRQVRRPLLKNKAIPEIQPTDKYGRYAAESDFNNYGYEVP